MYITLDYMYMSTANKGRHSQKTFNNTVVKVAGIKSFLIIQSLCLIKPVADSVYHAVLECIKILRSIVAEPYA